MAKRGPKGPSKYYPELAQELIAFYDIPHFTIKTVKIYGKNEYCKEEQVEVPNSLPHLITFAMKIGVCTDTLYAWGKVYPEFSEALKKCKELNERMLVDNAMRGLYNASFSIFTAKNKFGWRDEQFLKGEGFHQIFNVVIAKDVKPRHEDNRLLTQHNDTNK